MCVKWSVEIVSISGFHCYEKRSSKGKLRCLCTVCLLRLLHRPNVSPCVTIWGSWLSCPSWPWGKIFRLVVFWDLLKICQGDEVKMQSFWGHKSKCQIERQYWGVGPMLVGGVTSPKEALDLIACRTNQTLGTTVFPWKEMFAIYRDGSNVSK